MEEGYLITYQKLSKNDFQERLIIKSGRCGHRPRRSAEVGVHTNLEMGDENSIFKKLLSNKMIA